MNNAICNKTTLKEYFHYGCAALHAMLQQMFEVTATRFHTATKTFAPLLNSVVDDTLLQTGPLVKASSATSNAR